MHDWADAHGFRIVKEYEDAAISGTSKTGRKHRYYCAAQRRHECDMLKLRKDMIEDAAVCKS